MSKRRALAARSLSLASANAGKTRNSSVSDFQPVGKAPIIRNMPLKHAFVTACLNAGISVAMETDSGFVREFVNRLHPLVTEHPLIRIGARGDGGYLIPDDLEGVVACFSPGVDNRATFEASVIERGIPCFLADGSIACAPINGEMVHFTKKHLGVINNETTITLDDWVERNKPGNDDLILQMEADGSIARAPINGEKTGNATLAGLLFMGL